MFAPQKSVACVGRIFSSVENLSFRMNGPFGLLVGSQRNLGWMALFGQDNVPPIDNDQLQVRLARLQPRAIGQHPFDDAGNAVLFVLGRNSNRERLHRHACLMLQSASRVKASTPSFFRMALT